MSNSPISEAGNVRRPLTGRWLAACLAGALLVPSVGHAQLTAIPTTTTTVTTMATGLHWLSEKEIGFLTISEAGAPTALASVRLEFRDPTGRVLAATKGSIGPGKPVQLRYQPQPGSRVVQVSVFVGITTFTDAGNAPIAVFEPVGADSFVPRGGPVCGPGGRSGGNQQMCQGWNLTSTPQSPQ